MMFVLSIKSEVKIELLLNFAMMAVVILLAWIVKSLGIWPQFMGKSTVIFVLVLMLSQSWLHTVFVQKSFAEMTKKRQQIIMLSSVTIFPALDLGMIIMFSYFSFLLK
jgi:hypothetical protein